MKQFLLCFIIGFIAQMIDGMAGMAYGVSCRTILSIIMGLPASACSTVVHVSELPLTFVSGISHLHMKNVDKKLLKYLVIPGAIGAIIGAFLVSFSNEIIEVIIDIYLVIIGIKIVLQAIVFNNKSKNAHMSDHAKQCVAFIGGFFDAFGGGGWGPIVTSTLLGNDEPHKVIGTVNAAEFVVTFVQSIFFVALSRSFLQYWDVILAVVLGGAMAAPIAAKVCLKIPSKYLLLSIGFIIIILNSVGLINLL